MIRALIVDDHPVVRAAIRAVLADETEIEVVGEAGTGREALFEARALQPDVVLLDVAMPEQSGLEILPRLIAERPELKVLVLSMEDDLRHVRNALSSGAAGYVLKESSAGEVVDAIREVAAGGMYLSPKLGGRLLRRGADDPPDDVPLSKREREVLRLIAFGYTNLEIGQLLSLSVRTVEGHRAKIMATLQLQTRAELVRYALDRKLLAE